MGCYLLATDEAGGGVWHLSSLESGCAPVYVCVFVWCVFVCRLASALEGESCALCSAECLACVTDDRSRFIPFLLS